MFLEKASFIITLNEIRKSFFFKKYLPTPCLSKPLCVYVSTVIIHFICEWHAEAWGLLVCGGGRGGGGGAIVYS